jgi:hypothetical protein
MHALFTLTVDGVQYSLERLGGPHCQSGCYREQKNHLPLLGIELQFLSFPFCGIVTAHLFRGDQVLYNEIGWLSEGKWH